MDVPLPKHTAALGEVGLTGEVRGVARIDPRLSECARLGYSTVLVPKTHQKNRRSTGLPSWPVSTVGEAIAYCYEKKPVV